MAIVCGILSTTFWFDSSEYCDWGGLHSTRLFVFAHLDAFFRDALCSGIILGILGFMTEPIVLKEED
jgi:hypothetical protein